MYDHVLLPVDAAAEHAFDLAERYGATLHVVHVIDAMSATVTGFGDEVIDTLEREGRTTVEEVTGGPQTVTSTWSTRSFRGTHTRRSPSTSTITGSISS